MSKKNLSPEQKLMKSVFGRTLEEIEQRDAKYASEISDEEFERVWGISIKDLTARMSQQWDRQLAAARP